MAFNDHSNIFVSDIVEKAIAAHDYEVTGFNAKGLDVGSVAYDVSRA
jgi:hypothetical protein